MGMMTGVFARVTLVCVRGVALMLVVDVGLVELCCAASCCVGALVIEVLKFFGQLLQCRVMASGVLCILLV